MFPAWLRNGPQVKLPKTRTTGLGPISFESVTSSLPSLVLRVKSGAVSSSFGPGSSEPISRRKRPRTRVAFDGRPARRRPRRRRRGERFLQVGERQEALAAAVGRPEEGLELLARDLAVAVAVGTAEDHRPRGRGQRAAEKSKSGGVNTVVIAVEPREIGVGPGEFRAADRAVAILVRRRESIPAEPCLRSILRNQPSLPCSRSPLTMMSASIASHSGWPGHTFSSTPAPESSAARDASVRRRRSDPPSGAGHGLRDQHPTGQG